MERMVAPPDAPVLLDRVEQIYPALSGEASRAEALLSAVVVPLLGADGPLGLLTMCSRKD